MIEEKICGPCLSSTVRSSADSLKQDGNEGTAYKEAIFFLWFGFFTQLVSHIYSWKKEKNFQPV